VGDQRVVDAAWVKTSTEAHVRVDEETEYGYLWWLKTFKSGKSGAESFPAWLMQGTGGNKVAVFPEQKMVVVVTTTNYRVRGAHQLSDKLLTDFVLKSTAK
jgi:CubicO group peptidase (beta-lactamase class C family)